MWPLFCCKPLFEQSISWENELSTTIRGVHWQYMSHSIFRDATFFEAPWNQKLTWKNKHHWTTLPININIIPRTLSTCINIHENCAVLCIKSFFDGTETTGISWFVHFIVNKCSRIFHCIHLLIIRSYLYDVNMCQSFAQPGISSINESCHNMDTSHRVFHFLSTICWKASSRLLSDELEFTLCTFTSCCLQLSCSVRIATRQWVVTLSVNRFELVSHWFSSATILL
jgi:hypothetical protein